MARGYPRFLFSNPQNTKDKGPFIVHTMFPKAIFRIYKPTDKLEDPDSKFMMWGGYFHTVLLESELCSEEEKKRIVVRASTWFHHQPEFQRYYNLKS